MPSVAGWAIVVWLVQCVGGHDAVDRHGTDKMMAVGMKVWVVLIDSKVGFVVVQVGLEMCRLFVIKTAK